MPKKDKKTEKEPEKNVAPDVPVDETIDPASCVKCKESEAAQLRALADYQNLVRETEKQRVEFVKYATEGVIGDLLPTIDYFDAAMHQAPDLGTCDEATAKNIKNWLVGIQHVQKLLMDKLAEQGLQAVEPTGLFDPNTQEAAEEEESSEPEGTILRVVQRGFTLNEKLIRPARVIVAKKAETKPE